MRPAMLIALTLVLSLAAGLPRAAAAQSIDLGSEAQREAGRVVYGKYCSQCHGEAGDGRGIATPFLNPVPRDFTRGKYKIRSTPNGTVPSDADLERVIRRGIPYTAMPGFPASSIDEEALRNLIYVLKGFAVDFEDPEAYAPPVELPRPPAYDPEKAREEGLTVYQESGCKQCHGELGRADGGTAPTLRDDWGHFIRAADLTMPWTFRGGGTREDIFRTLTTGFNGTPMASFVEISEERRWRIADWIYSHADDGSLEDPYSPHLTAVAIEGTLDLPADPAAAAALFADAPRARFPVVGQIMEPGRDFHPSARAVEVRAIYGRDDIAFLVTWHDMAAEITGHNAPDLEVPAFLDELPAEPAPAAAEDVWGAQTEDSSGGGVWGDAAEEEAGGGSVWGDAEEDTGDTGDTGGGVWDQDPGAALAATPVIGAVESEFSDAVAVQVPQALPAGVRKPYFLFGDEQNPVEIWFADLAAVQSAGTARLYEGRGSAKLTVSESEGPEVLAAYDRGEWSVIFKRPRRAAGGLSFEEASFVPIAFSVWDGFNRERGNKRALTRWLSVYLEPAEHPSPVGPMSRAGLGVLALELLILFLVRRRRGAAPAVGAAEEVA